MKVIIDIRTKYVSKYPYSTTKLGKLYFPRTKEGTFKEDTLIWDDFGIDDSFFGGNICKIAAIKGKPFYILVSREDTTLGIIHRFADLVNYDKKDLYIVCDNQKIAYTTKDTKQDLIDRLTLLQDK